MGRPAILKIDITGDARKLGAAVDEADSKLSKLGGGAKKAGVVLAAGLGAAGVAAGLFAKSAVSAASDAEQALGAVQSIFGKNAASVIASAKGAADAVGLSSTAYQNMAAILGAQLTNMGRSTAEAAGETDKLIRLGSDLAATYGGSVADAVGAVSSLMKGETDPIERYGVSIKASDVSARLAAEGLDKLTGASAKQAQATAVLELLTQQTGAAHGQFAKQTDTLAEKQQILAAKFDNVKATVGAALLPVVAQLFTWFDEKVAPAATRLARAFGEQAAPALARVGAFVRDDVLPVVRQLVGFVVDRLLPVFVDNLRPILGAIGDAFGKVSASVREHRPELEKLGKAIEKVVEWAAKHLAPILSFLAKTAFAALGTAIATAVSVVSGMVDVVEKLWSALKKVGDIAGKVGGAVGKIGGAIGGLFGGPPLSVGGVQLVGDSGDLGQQVGRLATGALGDVQAGAYLVGGAAGRGALIVDRRDLSTVVRVDGALDPVAVAEQIERILRDHRLRLGAVTAYGAA